MSLGGFSVDASLLSTESDAGLLYNDVDTSIFISVFNASLLPTAIILTTLRSENYHIIFSGFEVIDATHRFEEGYENNEDEVI